MYIIFAYQSRSEAISLYSALKSSGIGSAVINTPKDASVGCGLSVKIYERALNPALDVFYTLPNSSFLGAFKLRYQDRRTILERISV